MTVRILLLEKLSYFHMPTVKCCRGSPLMREVISRPLSKYILILNNIRDHFKKKQTKKTLSGLSLWAAVNSVNLILQPSGEHGHVQQPEHRQYFTPRQIKDWRHTSEQIAGGSSYTSQ